MSYTLKFLFGLEIDTCISYTEDIVETFHKIIKIMHIFTNQKRFTKNCGKCVSFPSTIHLRTYILYQFYVKYSKIVLIFHLRQAGFTCIKISSFSCLHIAGRVSKPLVYK